MRTFDAPVVVSWATFEILQTNSQLQIVRLRSGKNFNSEIAFHLRACRILLNPRSSYSLKFPSVSGMAPPVSWSPRTPCVPCETQVRWTQQLHRKHFSGLAWR